MNDTKQGAAALAAFTVAGGSVTGRHHLRVDRPNQDAWAALRTDDAIAVAVCDGCGSGRRSEVGAVIGARLWVRTLVDALAGGDAADPALWAAARARVAAVLADLVAVLGDGALVDHGLFTSLVAVVTARTTAIYALGDGVVGLDDDVRTLGPFADDQPPYLGYDLIAPPAPPTLFVTAPTAAVSSLVLASDGADELAADELALLRSAGAVRNPDGVRRRLAVLHRATAVHGGPRFADDTTVVAVRRSAPC
jgi:hypothetical protein